MRLWTLWLKCYVTHINILCALRDSKVVCIREGVVTIIFCSKHIYYSIYKYSMRPTSMRFSLWARKGGRPLGVHQLRDFQSVRRAQRVEPVNEYEREAVVGRLEWNMKLLCRPDRPCRLLARRDYLFAFCNITCSMFLSALRGRARVECDCVSACVCVCSFVLSGWAGWGLDDTQSTLHAQRHVVSPEHHMFGILWWWCLCWQRYGSFTRKLCRRRLVVCLHVSQLSIRRAGGSRLVRLEIIVIICTSKKLVVIRSTQRRQHSAHAFNVYKTTRCSRTTKQSSSRQRRDWHDLLLCACYFLFKCESCIMDLIQVFAV